MQKKCFIFSLLMILCVQNLYAGGYQVMLQGNRQTAIGLNGAAITRDASSIFWNPGSMTWSKNSLQLGVSPIFANILYADTETSNGNYTARTNNLINYPFHVYAVYGKNKWKAGLGIYTPFGSRAEWEDTWKGRFILKSIDLKAIYFQPTFSYRLTDKIGIGAGLVYAMGSVKLSKAIPIQTNDGTESEVNLNGTTSGLGYNIGIQFQPTEKISIGVNYRSLINAEVEGGDAEFNVPAYLLGTSFPTDNTFSASLPLPANLLVGLGWQVHPRWLVAAEANLVQWSAYESLKIDFEKNSDQLQDLDSPRNYKNSVLMKLGAEYTATDKLDLRMGIYYDPSPADKGYITPETPNSNRINFTGGFGYDFNEKATLDMSLLVVLGAETSQSTQDLLNAGTLNPAKGSQEALAGSYKFNAIIPGVSFHYNF